VTPVAAIGAALVLSVAPAAHHRAPHRPFKVVVSEQYVLSRGRIAISPPTRLDVVMSGNDHVEVLFCLDMGGEPILYPHDWNYRPLRDVLVCEGIDY
jgi:hypothetical protein